jgi:hypothetical protein
MKADEPAETYHFVEKSNYGVMQGTVILIEHKSGSADQQHR